MIRGLAQPRPRSRSSVFVGYEIVIKKTEGLSVVQLISISVNEKPSHVKQDTFYVCNTDEDLICVLMCMDVDHNLQHLLALVAVAP